MTKSNLQSFNLTGKIALVTGAARGLGRSISLALAEAGADVALALREAGTGADLVAEIAATGRRAFAVQMDVSKVDQIEPAVAKIIEKFGRIDILVNNAGIGPPNPALKVTEADFDHTLGVNLKGTFFVSQAVGRVMVRQNFGRIVNLSSQAGFIALPTESVYCMTKAAIAHLTKCLAVEWAPHNVTVNAIAPTFIKTPGTEKWLKDDDFRTELLSRIPLGRVGEPKDITGAVVFLASPAADLITGTTILIDGGFTAR